MSDSFDFRERALIAEDALKASEAKTHAVELRAVAAELRIVSLEKQLEAANKTLVETNKRADDHPNGSWGSLYAERDMWRTAFIQAATACSADGLSLLEWRHRALQLQARIEKIMAFVATPIAQVETFIPHVLPTRALELVAKARAQIAEEARRLGKQVAQ